MKKKIEKEKAEKYRMLRKLTKEEEEEFKNYISFLLKKKFKMFH